MKKKIAPIPFSKIVDSPLELNIHKTDPPGKVLRKSINMNIEMYIIHKKLSEFLEFYHGVNYHLISSCSNVGDSFLRRSEKSEH